MQRIQQLLGSSVPQSPTDPEIKTVGLLRIQQLLGSSVPQSPTDLEIKTVGVAQDTTAAGYFSPPMPNWPRNKNSWGCSAAGKLLSPIPNWKKNVGAAQDTTAIGHHWPLCTQSTTDLEIKQLGPLAYSTIAVGLQRSGGRTFCSKSSLEPANCELSEQLKRYTRNELN